MYWAFGRSLDMAPAARMPSAKIASLFLVVKYSLARGIKNWRHSGFFPFAWTDRAKRILMEEFEKATLLGNQAWKRGGRILKIILFGSYARNDWVDDPKSGYQSDFDLLVVVGHEK